MNTEEKPQSIDPNNDFVPLGSNLPENVGMSVTSMPRQISILNWINQWQPMGIRVVLDLPFIADDKDFIFVIRNGPFIPTFVTSKPRKFIPFNESDQDVNAFPVEVFDFAFNNMRPVFQPSYAMRRKYPEKSPIHITYYDQPPMIATMASSFRRWRGDMQYRIRTVAGFATQGYVFVAPLKNVFSPIGIYNAYKFMVQLRRQSVSFKPHMQNSYILADTSMFRHLEITSPYDYPAPYYDQLAWIDRRCNPLRMFSQDEKKQAVSRVVKGRGVMRDWSEPHGDNWLAFGVRGDLAATQVGAQITFELEYRCMEGFQFADPWLPPADMLVDQTRNPNLINIRYPDSRGSDGIGFPTVSSQVLNTPQAHRRSHSPQRHHNILGSSSRN